MHVVQLDHILVGVDETMHVVQLGPSQICSQKCFQEFSKNFIHYALSVFPYYACIMFLDE